MDCNHTKVKWYTILYTTSDLAAAAQSHIANSLRLQFARARYRKYCAYVAADRSGLLLCIYLGCLCWSISTQSRKIEYAIICTQSISALCGITTALHFCAQTHNIQNIQIITHSWRGVREYVFAMYLHHVWCDMCLFETFWLFFFRVCVPHAHFEVKRPRHANACAFGLDGAPDCWRFAWIWCTQVFWIVFLGA